ncbi:MAG: DNA-binding protein [Bacteroidales bacterium]|nr:DNA-binding protein [Bacteroidales bacterium]
MIDYIVKPNPFENNSSYGKYFAQAVSKELITIEGLAKLMKNRNLPYSTGAIKGMLEDMVDCIKEQLLAGNTVKIDNLAIFGIGIRNVEDGAESEKDFNAAEHIKGVSLTCRAAGELMSKNVKVELKFNKVENCNCNDNQGDDDDQAANDGEAGNGNGGGDLVG